MDRPAMMMLLIKNRVKRIISYSNVVIKLGLFNVLYVTYYRLLMKIGVLSWKFPIEEFILRDPVFKKTYTSRQIDSTEWKEQVIAKADKILQGTFPYYSYHWLKISFPPQWFLNPFNGYNSDNFKLNWTKIKDFDTVRGDIKNIWEISRFQWTGLLARAYVLTGNQKYLNALNTCMEDWVKHNPVNMGLNWKCGQEASFRIFNLLNCLQILGQVFEPSDSMVQIIHSHTKRISLNIRYALSQKNNHATSEAAALYIGGAWLAQVDPNKSFKYLKYSSKGKRHLLKLVRSLTYSDGSFSQHSTNYHRLFLDTLSIAVYWNKKLKLQPLNDQFKSRANNSLDFLLSMTDVSGYCPNLGSNDGSRLLDNHSCDYLDYRPTLQLASLLFKGYLVFNQGPWNEVLCWYDLNTEKFVIKPFTRISKVNNSGYTVMCSKDSWAMIRFPYYKFRPSHNDVFHLDLWYKGTNLLTDAGSYSYFPDKTKFTHDLKSVHFHNTLSFDKKEQMPRISKFLLGDWLKPLEIGKIEATNSQNLWKGCYRSNSGGIHSRSIMWNNSNDWEIHDVFKGKEKYVYIGFNLIYCNYNFDIKNKVLIIPWGKIYFSHYEEIEFNKSITSSYYMQLEESLRIELVLKNNSEFNTHLKLDK